MCIKTNELKQTDVKTRKILSCNGSFHVSSDIDILYTRRAKGGRGLNSIKTPTNKYLNLVLNHQQPTLIRLANELFETFNIRSNDMHNKEITLNIKNQIKKQSP